MKTLILFFVAVLVLGFASMGWAGNPPPLFTRPVKLDDSGRPLYNPWDRQDVQRRERNARGPRGGRHGEAPRPQVAPQTPPSAGTEPAVQTVPRAAGNSALQTAPERNLPNGSTSQ